MACRLARWTTLKAFTNNVFINQGQKLEFSKMIRKCPSQSWDFYANLQTWFGEKIEIGRKIKTQNLRALTSKRKFWENDVSCHHCLSLSLFLNWSYLFFSVSFFLCLLIYQFVFIFGLPFSFFSKSLFHLSSILLPLPPFHSLLFTYIYHFLSHI